MLHIICSTFDKINENPNFIRAPSAQFNLDYKDEWLESDFGKRVITEIEQIPLIYPSVKMSIHAVCSVKEISTGGKNLFLCKYLDKINFMDRMGDNCFDILMDIADEKDVYMVTTGFRLYRPETMSGRPIVFDDFNRVVTNWEEWMIATDLGAKLNNWYRYDEDEDD